MNNVSTLPCKTWIQLVSRPVYEFCTNAQRVWFLPRCTSADAGRYYPWPKCPSVDPFVKRVNCDKTKETSAKILTPYKRSIFRRVLRHEKWLVGDDPLYVKFWAEWPGCFKNGERVSTDRISLPYKLTALCCLTRGKILEDIRQHCTSSTSKRAPPKKGHQSHSRQLLCQLDSCTNTIKSNYGVMLVWIGF